jgi:type I restriction enzyme S subunit
MIADLKPYPAYRLSEGIWLGEIPSHWTVRRMKYVLRETDSRSKNGKEQLLRVSQYTGVTQRLRADGLEEPDTRADSLVNYKRVEPNDLVINIMLAWNGSMGVSRYSGIASPAYCVYRFVHDAHPWYFHSLLRSPAYKSRIKASSTGVVESRLRLYSDNLGRIEAMVPPLTEQASIVRFLDWANVRLEQAIRAKRNVIALLNEQKQVIIHRAVTRGLDPSVPLKPSGIPWLGDIPQNFKRTKLGRVCVSIRDGTHNPPPALPGIHRLLSVRNVVNGHFVVRDDDRTMTSSAFAELQRSYTVRRGDVVIAIVGATTGKSAVVGEMRDVTVQRSLAILRPNSMLIDSGFLNLLISSRVVQSQIKQIMDKYAAQPGIYLNELSGLQMVYPSMTEQASIVAHVRDATGPLNTAISRLEREIDLLREYRTRLIADVVTGKLDVREAAAQLPEEPTPDTSEEDADLIIDPEAADEELAV